MTGSWPRLLFTTHSLSYILFPTSIDFPLLPAYNYLVNGSLFTHTIRGYPTMLSAAEVAAKWSRNLGQSTEAIRKGIERVTESPAGAAARSADLWQQRVSSAETKDKFRRNAERSTLEDWKRATLEKGLNRISSGAASAVPKMQAFLAEFLPHEEAVAQRVRSMPKGTLEDRINRAVAQIRGNAEFRRNR